jgi:hypothetical protein
MDRPYRDVTKQTLLDELAQRGMRLLEVRVNTGDRVFHAIPEDGASICLAHVGYGRTPNWKQMVETLPGTGIIYGL